MSVAQPTFTAQVDFTHDPTSASFTWVDLTSRALAVSTSRGRSYELSTVEAGTAQALLKNTDGALDPTNASSVYSPNVLPYRRVQFNATLSGTVYPLYTGLVERWPQQWANQYGTSPLQCVDIFAWLTNRTLRSAIEHEILNDAPLSFYPMTDALGALSAGDISGNSKPAAPITVGPNTTGSAAFGTTTALAGPINGLALASTQVGSFDNTAATYLAMSSGVLPATQPFTVEVWVQMTAAQAVKPAILYYAEGNDYTDTANEIDLQVIGSGDATNPGKVQLLVFGNDTSGSAAAVLSSATVLDGKPHQLVAVLNGTTVQLYIDGVSQGTATLATAWKNKGGIGSLGANLRDGVGQPFRGICAMFATYATALSGTRITAHYNAGLGFVGDTADARIARILGYAGWTATTALDACATTMLPAAIKGQSALAAIQSVAASEGGTFYVAKSGTLSYQSRRTRMTTTTSVVTFGENASGGEIPYVTVQPDFDPTYVYNDVQITRTSGAVAGAVDATSQTHYGDRSLTKTLDTQSDSETIDCANWLLASFKAPHLRIASIEVDAAATSGAWAALLPLEIGSRVTTKRRAPGSPNTISVDCFVEQLAWAIDANGMTAKCRLTLSPIPLQALIADSATFGICDSTYVAAW